MKTTSFEELIQSEIRFDNLLKRLNIPINNNDRVHKAYKLVGDFNKIRLDPIKSRKFLKEFNKKSEINFSVLDIYTIHKILPFISNENDSILKPKIKKILKGTLLPDENPNNSEPRNIQFELLLFSDLKEVKIESSLEDPNPDILVKTNGRDYYFQCKRIFNDNKNAFSRNIQKAKDQLNKDLNNKDNSFGIIALSVESLFTQGGKTSLDFSVKHALLRLKEQNLSVIKKYGEIWQDSNTIENNRIAGVILYNISVIFTKKENLQSTGSYLTLTHTFSSPQPTFTILKDDFKNLEILNKNCI